MTKYISCADTAKLIRKALKENFSGIKFSVKSSSYAGGASVHINWIDGPIEDAVESVVKFFQGATFDSSIDLKSYTTSEWEGEEVHFGADYVICSRHYSRTFLTAVASQFCERWGIPMVEIRGDEKAAWIATYLDYSRDHYLKQLLSHTDGKDMHRAYDAEKEREACQRAEWEKAYAKQQAEAKAQAEREAREQAEAKAKAEREEFEQWQREQLHNEQWQREQFKKWQQEREQLAREQAEREAERIRQEQAYRQQQAKQERERQQREQEERAKRQREQQERERISSTFRATLATREKALAYLGLTYKATHTDVMKAFRQKVKAAADGKGGYTVDMDFLVKVKEKALG